MPKDTSSAEYQLLKTEIRSVLISSQQGCTERELIKDYAAFNGNSEIPFRAMGYSNLMELLSSMPDVARIDHRRSPPIIMGVSDDNTRHIQELVQKQKKDRRSLQRRAYNNTRSYPTSQYPPVSLDWRWVTMENPFSTEFAPPAATPFSSGIHFGLPCAPHVPLCMFQFLFLSNDARYRLATRLSWFSFVSATAVKTVCVNKLFQCPFPSSTDLLY